MPHATTVFCSSQVISSVPSERVFRIGGNVVRSKRNSIKPHKVNQLIFLASNLNEHIS